MAVAAKRRASSRKKTQQVVLRDALFSSDPSWLNEALALVVLALAVFLLFSFLSLSQGPIFGENGGTKTTHLMGPLGHLAATILHGILGWASLSTVPYLLLFARWLWRTQALQPYLTPLKVTRATLGFLGVIFSCAVFGALWWGEAGGGTLGVLVARPLQKLFGVGGAALIACAAVLYGAAAAHGMGVSEVARCTVLWLAKGTLFLGVAIPALVVRTLIEGARGAFSGFSHFLEARIALRRNRLKELPNQLPAAAEGTRDRREGGKVGRGSSPQVAPLDDVPFPAGRAQEEGDRAASQSTIEPETSHSEDRPTHVVVKRRSSERKISSKQFEQVMNKPRKEIELTTESPDYSSYTIPSLNLLIAGDDDATGENDEELRDISRQIEAKLKDFGVYGRVTQVHPGPVITLFEFEPAPGVKVGRIAALQDDLAMSLKASSIRIIAPIPKRGTVGIEVPNRHRQIVRLREVLECEAFVKADSVLSIPLGKDTYGDPVVVDISLMPHLLMAGATGTGKSVCINAILLSLLYRATPQELGLILIDPKVLELSVYDGIPHLRVPVVTMPKQAKAVLDWATREMDRRYQFMQKFGVRNIDSYNRIVSGEDKDHDLSPEELKSVIPLQESQIVAEGTVASKTASPQPLEDSPTERESRRVVAEEKLAPLPKIVIVIDELADLMLTVGKDIEELITRLAQKARAAGIHLIVATQRPSVDVITGLIKANFPARLSFRTTSRIDSRTILDSMGAEKLLGRGDILFMQPGAEGLRRLHGAFVSDQEVKKVLAVVKDSCQPHYDSAIMEMCERALRDEQAAGDGQGEGEDFADEMYDKAVELVVQRGHASTSMIQRVFRIGYNRAARLIEAMEREGIVGPMDGAKPREVLVAGGKAAMSGDDEPF